MKPGPDPTTIYRIARCYYKDGLGQDDIAKREGFSRSQVSRLLDKAKEMGMVRIELVPPSDPHLEELAAGIEKGLGLKHLIITPVGAVTDDITISKAIATAAVDYIPSAIADCKVIGIGWGRTVYIASEQLQYRATKGDQQFVPLTGISGNENPNLQINTIIDRFSTKFKARGLFINSPAVREKGTPLTHIEQERILKLREFWSTLDVAIIGLGAPPGKSGDLITELSASYRQKLNASSVCGDILGQFFYEDGSLFVEDKAYEQLAFCLEGLKSLRKVICLAGGKEKIEGIRAAARARYITDLVTDEMTARMLAESL